MASTLRRPPAAPAPRRRLLLFLGALALLGGLALDASAQTISKEYQLKAAFLYNFSKFVQWPADRFADERSAIVIAVLGENPFGEELKNVVKNRVVNGRSIIVRHLDSAAELRSAHIVFVAPGAEALLAASISGEPGVLTVGETDGFAARGGIIHFTVVGEKVRFEINQASADKAGLKLSGQLLKLATAIRKTP